MLTSEKVVVVDVRNAIEPLDFLHRVTCLVGIVPRDEWRKPGNFDGRSVISKASIPISVHSGNWTSLDCFEVTKVWLGAGSVSVRFVQMMRLSSAVSAVEMA